jgi:ParB family chromosome partitioning protein
LIVTARKDKNSYLVLIGERRFRACKKAELEAVPCIVKDELSDQEIEELQLIENVQRHDLKPFEEIKLIKQLSDRGMTQHEMCATTGLSHGTVDVYLKIARTLPVEIQREIVKEGSHNPKELTLTKAVMLAESKANPATIEETVKQIQKDGLKPKALAKKLAQQGETKLHRVRESRIFWRELTRSVKKYAEYWNDYTTLKEYEEADAYHLELHVKLPKDLKTT